MEPTLNNPATQPDNLIIDSNSLQNQTPIEVPTSGISQPTPPIDQTQGILDSIQVPDTQAQQAATNLSGAIYNLLPELQGQTQDLIQAENQLGIGQLRTTLQGLNNRALQLNAELNADNVSLAAGLQQIEDRPIAMEFITGRQASLERRAQIARGFKVAELNTINAQALAAQGNIELAKSEAQRAVDAKYAPIREALDLYQSQLQALEPILSRDEKKQYEERQLKLNLAFRDLDKREAVESTIQELSLTAIDNGAPSSILSELSGITNINDAIKKLAPYLRDPAKILDLRIKNLELANAQTQKDLLQKQIEGGEVPLTPDQQSAAFKLIDDYEAASKDFVVQTSAYNKVVASAQDPSPAGDLALIFNFMKTLDPGSVVRESEFENAAQAASFLQRTYGIAVKFGTGQKLTAEQRKDFVDRAQKLYESGRQQQSVIDNDFSSRANRFNVPSSVVIRNLSAFGDGVAGEIKENMEATNVLNQYAGEPQEQGAFGSWQQYSNDLNNSFSNFSF